MIIGGVITCSDRWMCGCYIFRGYFDHIDDVKERICNCHRDWCVWRSDGYLECN